MTRARDVANLIGSGNYSSTTFTATAGQTAFTIAHTQGFVQVFMNGLLLDETVDWTSDGSAVTLTSGAAAGDEIEVVAYNTFSVGDALNQAAADARYYTQSAADTRYVNASGDTMSGDLTVSGAFTSQGIDDNATSTAMTLDSSGNLLVGKTSPNGSVLGSELRANGKVVGCADGTDPLYLNRKTSDGNIAVFAKDGSTVGSISVTSSGTTYNTTSDRRLKTDIEPISDGTEKLMAMNPITHKWMANPEAPAVHGFIAQEMQEVAPEAVSGDPDGKEMMSMDYGRITPMLVAALQDAHKKIELLEQRLANLEGM